MRVDFAKWLQVLAAALFGVMAPVASAADLEVPPSATASTILGALAEGEGYRIAEHVRSDGFLRIYRILTPNGDFEVSGAEMLDTRLRELEALSLLRSLDESREFVTAAGQAAAAPIKFAGRLVTDPVNTVSDTVSGIGRMVDRITSSIGETGDRRDDLMSQLAGISQARRDIAFRFKVDPYTDFPPLARRLEEVAKASAFGGLTVKAVFSFIPGAAGLAVAGASTADSAQSLMRDNDADELAAINRNRLLGLGIDGTTVDRFLTNPVYTPGDRTEIALDLARMADVRGLEIMLLQAARAGARDLAFFQRRRVRLLADYHTGVRRLTRFVSARAIPVSVTADGRALALFPMDLLSWSERAANAVATITAGLHQRQDLSMAGAEFRIAGEVTPAARRELERLGWFVVAGIAP